MKNLLTCARRNFYLGKTNGISQVLTLGYAIAFRGVKLIKRGFVLWIVENFPSQLEPDLGSYAYKCLW